MADGLWIDELSLGSLISDKAQKTARWREYYEQLLSRPPTHPPVDLAQTAASTPEDTTIDCGQTTVAEVARAIGRLKRQESVEFQLNW